MASAFTSATLPGVAKTRGSRIVVTIIAIVMIMTVVAIRTIIIRIASSNNSKDNKQNDTMILVVITAMIAITGMIAMTMRKIIVVLTRTVTIMVSNEKSKTVETLVKIIVWVISACSSCPEKDPTRGLLKLLLLIVETVTVRARDFHFNDNNS